MASRYNDPGTVSPVSELRHRRSLPDVPTDVDEEELMLHFNDPNYDFESNSVSETYYSGSPATSDKARYPLPSGYGGTTDVDTESQVSSSWRGTEKPSLEREEYHECARFFLLRGPHLWSIQRLAICRGSRCRFQCGRSVDACEHSSSVCNFVDTSWYTCSRCLLKVADRVLYCYFRIWIQLFY